MSVCGPQKRSAGEGGRHARAPASLRDVVFAVGLCWARWGPGPRGLAHWRKGLSGELLKI